jgi:hypothetical protein
MESLTIEAASYLANLVLGHVTREYPCKLDHVLSGDSDLRPPRELHPAFHGSFDWHSCVHGFWTLARLRRRFAGLPEAGEITELFDRQLTPSKIAAEVAYAADLQHSSFERPYGWAWLLALSAELALDLSPQGSRALEALRPLSLHFVRCLLSYLPKATYPVRAGTHTNTAFAVLLALEYADRSNGRAMREALVERGRTWYENDAACQAWEPSATDFLSPALVEAACMSRISQGHAFDEWLNRFFPELRAGKPVALFEPAAVSDRFDPMIVHLDGLNLSRAWCWKLLAARVADEALRDRFLRAARAHIAAAWPHVADDYVGSHWLATYAVLALDDQVPFGCRP